jgi:hypothetical protein
MASEQHNHRIQPLNGNNYTTWSEEMKALLRSKGLWRLVDGKEMRPSTPAKEQEAWDIKQDRAAGELMLNLMPDQRVHIRDSQDDPTAAWKALAALPVLSVTRWDTVNASVTRCNAPKTPTSRRSALADVPTRPTPPLLVMQSPLDHPQLQMPLRTWWNVRATQVFVPGIPLILYPLSNSMLTSIGMQTRGPLLI